MLPPSLDSDEWFHHLLSPSQSPAIYFKECSSRAAETSVKHWQLPSVTAWEPCSLAVGSLTCITYLDIYHCSTMSSKDNSLIHSLPANSITSYRSQKDSGAHRCPMSLSLTPANYLLINNNISIPFDIYKIIC